MFKLQTWSISQTNRDPVQAIEEKQSLCIADPNIRLLMFYHIHCICAILIDKEVTGTVIEQNTQ